jgi:hypothetical protein
MLLAVVVVVGIHHRQIIMVKTEALAAVEVLAILAQLLVLVELEFIRDRHLFQELDKVTMADLEILPLILAVVAEVVLQQAVAPLQMEQLVVQEELVQ